MRPIKFMAWHKKLKLIRQVLALELEPENSLRKAFILVWDHPSLKAAIIKGQTIKWAFEDCEVLQFTGLFDKGGKEIYESDILINVEETYEGLKRGPFVVEWGDCNNYCGFVARGLCQTIGHMFLAKNFKNCEIIGNIYENPELLSPTKETQ